jgi:lysyl-tRNA synthetase class 2
MKFAISEQILKKYPKLNIGIVAAKGIDNTGRNKEIDKLLKEVEDYIQLNFTPSDLAKHDLISPWRTVYSEFGAKPSKYHSSIEAMMRRILKGSRVPAINKIVDLYNYLSLKHLIPMGSDDIDKVDGDILLAFADGSERFKPLGTPDITENPDKGEVVYKDNSKILCRRWNWRDCDETKLTEKSKNVVLYVEGLPPVTKKKLTEVCKELADLIKTFCGGEVKYHILNKTKNSAEF